MVLRGLTYLVAGLLLASCAGSPYHPMQGGVGYTDLPTGPGAYQVTFTGTGGMGPAEARQYALTRASEITVLQHADAFQILDERILITYQSNYWPGTTSWWPSYGPRGRTYYQPVYEPGYTDVYTVPEAFVAFRLAPAGQAGSVPAAYLLKQAVDKKWPLSAGVAEQVERMPAVSGAALPAAPVPTTRAAGR